MTESTNPAVVIYAAKSTADEHGSIPDQIERCRKHADERGWGVIEPPESDEAASAYTGSRGPGLVRAKARAAAVAQERGDCILLVFASDRLARGDGRAAAHLLEHVLDGLKSGYRIESVTEELGGDLALVLASLYGHRAHADSRAKSEHTKRGIAKMVREGRHHGRAPYGYRWLGQREEQQLVVDEPQAAVVRRIFSEYLDGAGVARLALRLTANGVPAPRAKAWDPKTVANILDCVVYLGKVHVNGEEFDGNHEPILDEATWQRAQLQRSDRRAGKMRGQRPTGSHLLIGGLLRCGVCGAGMRPRTPKGRQPRYECSTRNHGGRCDMSGVLRVDVDEPLLRYLEEVVFDVEETRAVIAQERGRRLAESQVLIAEAERAAGEADAALERIRGDYVRGAITAEEWQALREELEGGREASAREEAQLRARADEVAAGLGSLDAEGEAAERLAELRAAVAGEVTSSEGLEAARAALARVFEAVVVIRTEDGLVLAPKVRAFEEIAAWTDLGDGRTAVKPVPQSVAVPGARIGRTPS